MNSDRRGQSNQVLTAVRDRHLAIQKIEQQMTQLAQLFSEMEAMVVQQDPVITNIEQQAEQTHDNMKEGNVYLGKAADSAAAARRKKWIYLGIASK